MDKNTYLVDLSESDAVDFGKVDFAKQSNEQKVFSAIWELEGQVNNGGFLQYFQSDRGETANFAVPALKRINAGKCAAIVERAFALLPDGALPNDPDDVEELIDQLSEEKSDEFEAVDSDFMEYPDNLTDLLFEFVRQNPKTFGPVPANVK